MDRKSIGSSVQQQVDTTTKSTGIFNSKEFQKDIQDMLFGFGDSWPSNKDSLSLLEILVKQFIEDLSHQALAVAEIRGKLDVECFLFVIRKDPRKLYRIQTLLSSNEQIKKARTMELSSLA